MKELKPLQKKEQMIMFCLLGIVGIHGIHRLKMGYNNWWLMLLSGGACWVWTIIDLIDIFNNKMTMADGRELESSK